MFQNLSESLATEAVISVWREAFISRKKNPFTKLLRIEWKTCDVGQTFSETVSGLLDGFCAM